MTAPGTTKALLHSLTARARLLDLPLAGSILARRTWMAVCLTSVAAMNSPCSAWPRTGLALTCMALPRTAVPTGEQPTARLTTGDRTHMAGRVAHLHVTTPNKFSTRARNTVGVALHGTLLDKRDHTPSAVRRAHRTLVVLYHRTQAVQQSFFHRRNTEAHATPPGTWPGTEGNSPSGKTPHMCGCHRIADVHRLAGTYVPRGCDC